MTSVRDTSGARVVAVSRALPAYVDIRGARVLTSIVRERLREPLVVGASGAEGNQTAVHTEHLLAFPSEHYDHWADRFGVPRGTWPYTHWGENITFEGLLEHDLPIGTMLKVGRSARLQVTSPRHPCFKLSWRIGQPDAVLPEILSSGRGGFYLRVIEPGSIVDGDAVQVELPAHRAVTVADVARLLVKGDPAAPERFEEALATEGLGVQCAGMLRQKLIDRRDRDRTDPHRWEGWRRFTVDAARDVADGVMSFELRPADGGPLAGTRAGQHVRVRLAGSDRPLTRSWSLSGYADRPDCYRLSIKRGARRAASAYMHDEVRAGSIVELSAPAGHFYIDRSSVHPTVLISAGIGLTPLLAMLHAYVALGPQAPPLHWIHVAKNGGTYAHRDEIDALTRGRANILSHVRFTQPRANDRLGVDFDAAGRLTLEELRRVVAVYRYPIFGRDVEVPGAASEFYLCGPAEFERDVRGMLSALGAAPTSIRSESFGIAGSSGTGGTSRVRFVRSGIEVDWEPGSSLLECAEAAGIAAEHECRSGSCHRCAIEVLSGETAYIREPVVRPDVGLTLACCSRPAGPALALNL